MVGVDKNKLSDLFKKKDDKEEKKKKAKEALSRMKTTAKKKPAKNPNFSKNAGSKLTTVDRFNTQKNGMKIIGELIYTLIIV